LNPAAKIFFDDANHPVPAVGFDFDAVDLKAELEAARERIAELEARLDVERRDHKADTGHYRDKLAEFARFTCGALIGGKPSAEIAGRRVYFFALLLKQSPFSSQAELARHLGLTPGAVCQQLNAFKANNPLFLASNRESN